MIRKFLYYLNFANWFKKNKEDNFNLRFMHGINRISILVFLIAMIIMILRYFIF